MVDEEIRDAGEAGTEHATIATSIAAPPRWGERARDRATSWRGALDDPGQSEAGGGGRAGLAAGRRRHRRGSRSPAVWAGRGHARPAAAGRAGLGGPGARTQASWRHDVDPLGGIPRGPFRGLRLQPLLRPSSWIRTAADPRDAPAPCRRGEGVRRLFGQADRDRRSDDGRDPRGGDFRRRARRLEPHLRRGDLDETLPDWTGAHVRMFRFFGGAPKLLVPDNLKSGVIKASFYDPEINRTYGAMAAHYSVGILPARPRRPRDKAKVEAGVRFAQTYILGRLRHLTFFSLAECNAAIALVMQRMNERPMRNLGLSRRELFETIERDALIGLPAADWEFAEWRRARVNLDYHIEVHDFLYSVPHALIRAEVDLRITARTVEIFHRGQRVGAHQRLLMHGPDFIRWPRRSPTPAPR